jgi:hypothetical protein
MVGSRQHFHVTRRIAVGPQLDVGVHAVAFEPGLQTGDLVGTPGVQATNNVAGEQAGSVDLQLDTKDIVDT